MKPGKQDPRVGDGAVPYPPWAEIAAEVRPTSAIPDDPASRPGGKGWYDLLAEDEAARDGGRKRQPR